MSPYALRQLATQLTLAARAMEDAANAIEQFERQLPLGEKLADMGFSVRSSKAFQRMGIETIDELCALEARELLKLKYFGFTALAEVRGILKRKNRYLRNDSTRNDE